MTTEELKKKIDGLFFGLHSTNPGDINALPEILNALVETASAGANVQSDWNENDNTQPDFIKNKPTIPKIIELSGFPTEAMTTQAQLDAIGITEAEIEAASKGERMGVFYFPEGGSPQFLSIEYSTGPTTIGGYMLVFRASNKRYTVQSLFGAITVTVTDLS